MASRASTQAVVIEVVCDLCGGTGLTEPRTQAAGLCLDCKGAGCRDLEVIPFSHRAIRDGVARVIGIASIPSVVHMGGGVSYDEFLADPDSPHKPGAECRQATCPAQWYSFIKKELVPKWSQCGAVQVADAPHVIWSDCNKYQARDDCWRLWDVAIKPEAERLYALRKRR